MHKLCKTMIAVVVTVFGVGAARCETYTMETYYPSPAGVYTNVTVTSSTVLARDGGNVGVGTATPASRLSVAGGVQPGNDTSACTADRAGTLRWSSGKLEVCDGSWTGVGGISATTIRTGETGGPGLWNAATGTVLCLRGELLLGGGAACAWVAPGDPYPTLYYSYPFNQAPGWGGWAYSCVSQGHQVKATGYAICGR